jgi:16S rRNA (guanine966-N2)-methyltransferase
VRPTTDRVRESLFNILSHRDPPVLAGAVVLDLCAGTGALGLEALSRGAAKVVFVDQDARSLALVRENVTALKAGDLCEVVKADSAHLPSRALGATLTFLDPPYGKGLIGPSLASAARGGWLASGALAVIELGAGEMGDLPDGWELLDDRRYGTVRILFAQYEP